MKVAIATDQGYVSAHFGRCPSYTIYEVVDGKVQQREEIDNPGHQPGFLPGYLSERGVNVIIAGGMGPRAQGLFAQNNITTVLGVQGPVDEIITKFINQELAAGEDLCDHDHSHGECADHAQISPSMQIQGSKICITTQGPELDSEVDPRFGRAPYFLIVNPDTLEFEALANDSKDMAHGAGIQTAQLIAGKKVSAVLTGQCGPKAQQVLDAAGIQIIGGVTGKAKDAVESLIRR
ncbi:NifB/NifX family molybdenum-iron cluster-binding protein [Acidobacteriota bacterium]